MIVQLTFFLFMLFGIAALTIGMGYVRLSQTQMQIAADTAAIEGLRKTRPDAAAAVKLTYDDDFNLATVNTERRLGAGPQVAMNDTGDSLNASHAGVAGYDADAPSPVYSPDLQLNAADERHGDMLRGQYAGSQPHTEDRNYDRPDFTANPSGTAFLVRMRRTDARNPLDRQPDVSSSGESLPLFFGRASTIHTDANANGWVPRRDGVTVRATAIADIRPVRQIGPDQAAPYAMTLSFWNFLAANQAHVGRVGNSFTSADFIGEAGKFLDNARRVGIQIDLEPIGSGTVTDGLFYAPIYDDTGRRVIGFGKVSVGIGLMTRLPAEVVTNGSAIVTSSVPPDVITANSALLTNGALLAPVLVR